MNNYQDKQERKKEAYERLAKKHHAESDSRYKSASAISDNIPFGQPILVGHHSERRHRKDLERIDTNMRKGIEHNKTAEYYENKVGNIENPRGISSDDPEAVQKLNEKIAGLEKQRVETKAIKKIPRDYSFSKEDMRSVHLVSLGAEIRRCKQRIQELESVANIQEEETVVKGVTVSMDKDDNRIRLHFPGKPSEEIRTQLKRHGFRWSPYNTAWQKPIHGYVFDQAKELLERIL